MSIVFDPRKVRGRDLYRIADLAALRAACKRLGLEFLEGHTAYHTWNDRDPAKPKAEHTIRLSKEQLDRARKAVKFSGGVPYEIGVIRSDEDNCWYLASDNDPRMAGSKLLAQICGPVVYSGMDETDRSTGEITEAFGLLMQGYYVEAQKAEAAAYGYSCYEQVLDDGRIAVYAEIPA